MTALTDSLVATAQTLLTKYGESVSFTRVAEGAYDPATSGVAAGTTTNYSGYAVPTQYTRADVDGELIKASDIRLIVEQTTTEPNTGDVVTVDGVVHRIMNVSPIKVTNVDIIYILQIRK